MFQQKRVLLLAKRGFKRNWKLSIEIRKHLIDLILIDTIWKWDSFAFKIHMPKHR